MVEEFPAMSAAMQMTMVVAEALKLKGFEDVRAVAPGFEEPRMVRGAHTDHRPEIDARYHNGRLLLVDTYDATQTDEVTRSRWQLFTHAALRLDAQFHVVVPDMVNGQTGAAFVRKKARKMRVGPIHKIWEV